MLIPFDSLPIHPRSPLSLLLFPASNLTFVLNLVIDLEPFVGNHSIQNVRPKKHKPSPSCNAYVAYNKTNLFETTNPLHSYTYLHLSLSSDTLATLTSSLRIGARTTGSPMLDLAVKPRPPVRLPSQSISSHHIDLLDTRKSSSRCVRSRMQTTS